MRKKILAFLLLIIVLVGVAEFTSGCGKTVHNQKDRQELNLNRKAKVDKTKEYRKGCKKLALWIVRNFDGVKEIDFDNFEDEFMTGKSVDAELNNNEDANITFSVDSFTNPDMSKISTISSSKNELKKAGIKMNHKNNKNNLTGVKVKISGYLVK